MIFLVYCDRFQLESTTVDKEILKFIEKSAQYINSQVCGDDRLIQEETADLQCVFGSLGDKFLPATQTSLISAGVLWKLCSDIDKKDLISVVLLLRLHMLSGRKGFCRKQKKSMPGKLQKVHAL